MWKYDDCGDDYDDSGNGSNDKTFSRDLYGNELNETF